MTHAEECRRWRQENPAKTLTYDARRRARLKQLPFTITAADVQQLLDAGWVCIYCGTALGSYQGGQRRQTITLDRLIPSLGYTPCNVELACHQCNTSKAEHTPATLRAWADRIEAVIQNRHNPETK